jgi:hypothetical protein
MFSRDDFLSVEKWKNPEEEYFIFFRLTLKSSKVFMFLFILFVKQKLQML